MCIRDRVHVEVPAKSPDVKLDVSIAGKDKGLGKTCKHKSIEKGLEKVTKDDTDKDSEWAYVESPASPQS